MERGVNIIEKIQLRKQRNKYSLSTMIVPLLPIVAAIKTNFTLKSMLGLESRFISLYGFKGCLPLIVAAIKTNLGLTLTHNGPMNNEQISRDNPLPPC